MWEVWLVRANLRRNYPKIAPRTSHFALQFAKANAFANYNFPNLYVTKKQSPERRMPKIYSKEKVKPGKITKSEPNTNPKIKK